MTDQKESAVVEAAPVGVDRRSFVSGAALAGASIPLVAVTQVAAGEPQPTAAGASPRVVGADYMVDVMRSLKLDYVAANPGSSFRGLHEAVVNYAGNQKPELIMCMHEESSVAIAHGYAKAAGKPMAIMAHSTVGLMHASMGLYNAWCDRVPIVTILGNIVDASQRRPGVEWQHTAQDPAAMVRDFIKWDDQPGSLQHFGESLVRAHKIATTPPMAPVVLVADGELQEMNVKESESLRIPKYTSTTPPQGDSNAVREAARLLVAAENPVIIADRLARTPQGMALLVTLAEALGAPVIDQGGRMNFPNTHPLSQNERSGSLIRGADVILALELTDVWGTLNEYIDNIERTSGPKTKAGAKVISISVQDLYIKSNYQDFQRYAEVDFAIAADGEATLPSLIEYVRGALDDGTRRRATTRTDALRQAKAKARDATKIAASYAWDASPISTSRLCAELWAQIKGEDWALVSSDNSVSSWPRRLWPFEQHHRYLGHAGGAGVGYGLPAAVGAALAYRSSGHFAVNIQSDGDLMYAPGALWTAVHHRIPVLNVMHNNRAYHQEVMHIQRMANRHNRGVDRAHIGNVIDNPFIDYAKLAQSMGMYAEGPISDPAALGPALKRAVAAVKRGEPALVDVVTQPR